MNGLVGDNFIALICNNCVATFLAISFVCVMPQKYKVFFNRNVVYLGKKAEKNKVHQHVWKDLSAVKIEELSHLLLQNSKNETVFIECSNLSASWKLFKGIFQVKKAAGGLVVNTKKQMLFIKRHGLWDIPKGHIEKGETKETAALREVSEECGINHQQIVKKLKTTYHTYYLDEKLTLKPSYWYLMKYTGTESTQPQIKEGITEAVWVSAEKVPELLLNAYPSICDVIDEFIGFDSAFSIASI